MLKFISSIRLAVILIATLAGMAVSATIFDQPDVFTSRPFLAVVAIFFVNLLTCTVQLWPALIRRLRRQVSDIAAKKSGFVPVDMTSEDLQALLKQERFSLHETKDGEDTVLYAVRGRLALMAPHVL
ncbi:MAG: cytochrome c biogenesis protein ResB, partial [Peptococcus niger]